VRRAKNVPSVISGLKCAPEMAPKEKINRARMITLMALLTSGPMKYTRLKGPRVSEGRGGGVLGERLFQAEA
jgi:hypothetical protein